MRTAPTGLTEAKEYLIQYRVEDNLMWKGHDLLEGWTELQIAEKRVAVLNIPDWDWQSRAAIYRQINVLRTIKIALSKDTMNETAHPRA